MAEEQDKTHRLLFQFPRMIQDLIRLCLGGKWIERLDFDTLERVPERLLSRELARREQDVLWRLRYFPGGKIEPKTQAFDRPRNYLAGEDVEILEPEEEYFYVYIHLEHQSHPRSRMALDMVIYKLLAIQDLTRNGFRVGDKLPNIFGMVFYNGKSAWNAPTSLLEMLGTLEDGPESLDFWSYKLIDTQRLNLEELISVDSPLLGLFQLEQLKDPQELGPIAAHLRSTLGPEEDPLADAFVSFINEVILAKLNRGSEQPIRIENLEEAVHPVSQRMERLTQTWQREGERRGERKMLRRLLERKFGELPHKTVEQLEGADIDLLLNWSDRILTATALDDVFAD